VVPGRAVACTTNTLPISPVMLNADTCVASCVSYTIALFRRDDSPSASTRAVMSSAASSGVKYSGEGQPR
jgi:hypothetical protein